LALATADPNAAVPCTKGALGTALPPPPEPHEAKTPPLHPKHFAERLISLFDIPGYLSNGDYQRHGPNSRLENTPLNRGVTPTKTKSKFIDQQAA
jgi:hypothetical protein